jgi:hypothetical protein
MSRGIANFGSLIRAPQSLWNDEQPRHSLVTVVGATFHSCSDFHRPIQAVGFVMRKLASEIEHPRQMSRRLGNPDSKYSCGFADWLSSLPFVAIEYIPRLS